MKKHNWKQQQSDAVFKEDDLFDFKIKPTKPRMKNHASLNSNKQTQKQNATKSSNVWWKAEAQQFDCEDSLKDLKNGKISNLNDKIELLKLELKSVLESSAHTDNEILKNNSYDDSPDILKISSPVKSSPTSRSKLVSEDFKPELCNETSDSDFEYPKIQHTHALANSTPFKDLSNGQTKKDCEFPFSQISRISESEDENFSSVSNTSSKNGSFSKEGVPSTSKLTNSKYDMLKLSQFKVEKLLYKSFLLQNLCQKVSSDESSCEANVYSGKKKRKLLTKKQNVSQKRKRNRSAIQSSSRKRRKTTRKHLKKKVRVDNLIQNTTEVVDDLNIESLNFDEPFYIDSTDDDSSDLEIVKNDYKNYDKSVICIDEQKSFKQNDVETSWKAGSNSSKIYADTGKEKNTYSLSSSDIWECPICFEPSRGQEIVTTTCGHIFCKDCIYKFYSKSGKTCPSCRGDLDGKKLIPLCDID